MASFGGRKPLIDVDLFEPLVVPASQLLLFYTALVAFDYLLLRNEPHLPLTGIPLRILLAIIHAFIPLAIVSPYAPYNLFFAACPWFIVSYTAALPTSRLSFSQYLNAFYVVVLDVTDDERLKMAQGQSENFGGSAALDPVGTRVRGLLKIGLGIGKWMLVTRCVDPLLPEKYSVLFSYSWLDPKSLALTLLLGIKAYLLLGVTDIGCGIEQMILGVRMVDLFHSPIISSSPMEFWSRRWNRAVRNLLHELIFLSSSKTDARGRYWRGLLVFFVSGLFHELIIMSCCRKMTLENLLFFTLHGAAVLAQVSVRVLTGSKCSPHSLMRIFCIASHLLFLTLTGRLFLAPFIRYNFLGIIVN